MQFAQFSVRIDAPEIVNTVRQVGILLYLADHHVWTDGVGRPRGNEKRVARSDRVRFEEVFQRVGRQSLAKWFFVYPGLHPELQLRSCRPGNRLPRRAFSSTAS